MRELVQTVLVGVGIGLRELWSIRLEGGSVGGRSWSAGVTVGVSGKGCLGGADKVLDDWD